MDTPTSLLARFRAKDPIDLAGFLSIGVTCVIALHALIWPQFRDLDFALYLGCLAAFVSFSIGYLVWFRFFRKGAIRRGPDSPEGPNPPAVDAPLPVPTGPRPRGMCWGEAKALPVEWVRAREVISLPVDALSSDEPIVPMIDNFRGAPGAPD